MEKLKTVGIRDLKNRISEYLREVRLGTTFLVTDRGTVIAELREPSTRRPPEPDSSLLEAWTGQGRVRPPRAARSTAGPTGIRLPDGASGSILDQERGG